MNEQTDNDLHDMTRDELIAEVKRLRQMTFVEPEKPVEYLKIVVFSILIACLYGIAHDLVTTQVCIEYFLPPVHPMIVPTANPFLLALTWGIVATWWVGLLLGVPLVAVCRFGRKPKLSVKEIVSPVLFMLLILYVASMLLGMVGYIAKQMGLRLIPPYFETIIAPERFSQFQFALFAHNAAYLFGTIGGFVLMFRLWKKRQTLAQSTHYNSHIV